MVTKFEVNKEPEKPLCVFGVMDNTKGHAIEGEMLPWLVEHYNVTEVVHDGLQYELPALQVARGLSVLYGEPVLYIHTRGAFNEWRTTIPTRKMWQKEFGNQRDKYQLLVDDYRPTIACPFLDNNGTHRYNGFVANAAAWELCELLPATDRMDYEHLWRGKEVRMIGTLIQSDGIDIKKIRKYLYRNFE